MSSILQALWLVVMFSGNPVTLDLQQSQSFPMRSAWYNGARVRYVSFAASDYMVAKQLDYMARFSNSYVPVDWSLALKCALDKDVLGDVYFINCAQTTIFSSEPGQSDYTPLWRVHYLEFAPNTATRPIKTIEQVEEALASGELEQIRPDSVLDASIVQDSAGNVIRQAINFKIGKEEIELPVVKVFFRLKYQPQTRVGFIAMVDTSDFALADQLGANYSPRLANLAPDCCDPTYAFVDPVAPGQLPIIRTVQEYRAIDGLQANQSYNPFRCWSLFSREAPPAGTGTNPVINNQNTTDYLVEQGIISEVEAETIVTNSPSVSCLD